MSASGETGGAVSRVLFGSSLNAGTRAFLSLCYLKGEGCNIQLTLNDENPDFERSLLVVNPKMQLPVLVDDGFIVREDAAILIYWARKNNWHELLGDDLRSRARVNQYLNYHDSSTKMLSCRVVIPYLMKNCNYAGIESVHDNNYLLSEALSSVVSSDDYRQEGLLTADIVCEQIEESYFTLDQSFLCSNSLTVADILAYSELGLAISSGLVCVDNYPKLKAWHTIMSELLMCEATQSLAAMIKKSLVHNEESNQSASDHLTEVMSGIHDNWLISFA